MNRLRKGDSVIVISGKDKGKKGNILSVSLSTNRVLVSGVNIRTRHFKPNKMNPKGGLDKSERSVHISNVCLLDPKLGLPTRIGYKILSDGTKVRYSRRTDEVIDVS